MLDFDPNGRRAAPIRRSPSNLLIILSVFGTAGFIIPFLYNALYLANSSQKTIFIGGNNMRNMLNLIYNYLIRGLISAKNQQDNPL